MANDNIFYCWIFFFIVKRTLWVRIPLTARLCDKVCQWLAADLWFSLGTWVSSTNKTDCYDITEILLKIALNTIKKKIHCFIFLSSKIRWLKLKNIVHVYNYIYLFSSRYRCVPVLLTDLYIFGDVVFMWKSCCRECRRY
jgi:hypothetical protein